MQIKETLGSTRERNPSSSISRQGCGGCTYQEDVELVHEAEGQLDAVPERHDEGHGEVGALAARQRRRRRRVTPRAAVASRAHDVQLGPSVVDVDAALPHTHTGARAGLLHTAPRPPVALAHGSKRIRLPLKIAHRYSEHRSEVVTSTLIRNK